MLYLGCIFFSCIISLHKLLFLIKSCQFEPCCLLFILLTTFDRHLCACVRHTWAYYWMDYPSKRSPAATGRWAEWVLGLTVRAHARRKQLLCFAMLRMKKVKRQQSSLKIFFFKKYKPAARGDFWQWKTEDDHPERNVVRSLVLVLMWSSSVSLVHCHSLLQPNMVWNEILNVSEIGHNLRRQTKGKNDIASQWFVYVIYCNSSHFSLFISFADGHRQLEWQPLKYPFEFARDSPGSKRNEAFSSKRRVTQLVMRRLQMPSTISAQCYLSIYSSIYNPAIFCMIQYYWTTQYALFISIHNDKQW